MEEANAEADKKGFCDAELATNKQTREIKQAGAALLQSMNQAASLAQEMKAASKEPYTGMQSESGGIIGMLEVILSDFARLQTDTETAEDEAETAYTKFMNESDEDVAVKTTTMKHLEAKKQRTDEAVAQAKKELELTQEELDAALAYFEKLKPDCLDTGL